VSTRTFVRCYWGSEMKKAGRGMYRSTSGSEVECILNFGPEIRREDTSEDQSVD